VFPFKEDSLQVKYHLVIVSKPGIPLVTEVDKLSNNFCYRDSTGQFPKAYSDNNLLSYYSRRNIALLKHFLEEDWVDPSELVVAGHSEGSTVAAKMAQDFKKITHLIYSGGNPLGRIMSIVQKSRAEETDTDSTRYGEEEFRYWSEVVNNNTNMSDLRGDTHKATYEFSIPPLHYMTNLKIPVMVTYGTKDWSAPFNDYMRAEMIRQHKNNFTFRPYINTEHNFFPVDANNKPDTRYFNWDNVANDWLTWLRKNPSLLKPKK
jgi:pimeloyl-ACP methyl ester carboxylesterase